MFRQPLVEERVVRAQQIERAPVLAQDAFEEELRFLAKCLAKIVVEIREPAHVRRDGRQVAQVQPLRREVGHQGARTNVGEHAPHLPFEHGRVVKCSRNRPIQQVIVRNTAPEEK